MESDPIDHIKEWYRKIGGIGGSVKNPNKGAASWDEETRKRALETRRVNNAKKKAHSKDNKGSKARDNPDD